MIEKIVRDCPLCGCSDVSLCHAAGRCQGPTGTAADVVTLKLVPDTKAPTEAETAADLKRRMQEAMAPVLALMDEAASKGLLIQFDGIAPAPPLYRNTVINLRVAKYY